MITAVDVIAAADVERWARALGVWLGMHERWACGSGGPPWRLTPLRDGLAVVRQSVKTSASKRVDVDPLTAAILLIGYARGLRVDVGECPACNGTRHLINEGPFIDPAMVARARRENLRIVSHGHGLPDGLGHLGPRASALLEGCLVCVFDGTPTGRHALTWEAAIIAAMPRDLGYDAHRYATKEHAQRDAEALARLTKRDPSRYAVKRSASEDGVWRLHEIEPGDATTREALRVMAHTIAGPEHVAVTSDWRESGNALAGFRGEPQGGLGELLAAWLRGPVPDRLERELARAMEIEVASYVAQLVTARVSA